MELKAYSLNVEVKTNGHDGILVKIKTISCYFMRNISRPSSLIHFNHVLL